MQTIFYKIDWDTEVDKTLTFNEVVKLLMAEYPGVWKSSVLTNYYKKIKQIVFIKQCDK